MASASALALGADFQHVSPTASKVYIAVMGATGSGKSSLISSITGREGLIGHDLETGTSEVGAYEITMDSTTLVLVDTPGFDDIEMSDYQILNAIAAWLENSCEKGQLLSGLVYLHQINKTRMSGSAIRALHLFQRICGEDNYKNVILATTFWNKIEHCKQEGIDREERLLANEGFWKLMIEKGAKPMRLGQDYRDILPALLAMAEKPTMTLEIQQELSNGLGLEQTMAGLFINKDSEEFQMKQEMKTTKLQEDFERRLEEQQSRLDGARGETNQKLVLKEQEHSESMEANRRLMEHQMELYQLNQSVKQAELRARLREEEETEARERELEAERLRQRRREAQERESRQRRRLSLTQRKTVDQQLDLLRAARAGGVTAARVGGVFPEGIGSVPPAMVLVEDAIIKITYYCILNRMESTRWRGPVAVSGYLMALCVMYLNVGNRSKGYTFVSIE
ncbi:hypothetical protein JMJ35_009873 [Cladonia borealis]|uniref:G domain-containing protein n=1 Tax=Cladonia borealis TaxID=184061 RepID=A0AA39QT97_9LECA|nr:hypothetical protein JMJ35_009873 [Cladonia borealis]